jgi:hypothetical protein
MRQSVPIINEANHSAGRQSAWCWTKLVPLLLWIALILWVASRPKATFFPGEVKTLLGVPRELLQYPYHFGAFFILAVFFRRCLTPTFQALEQWKISVLSLIGCAAVSLVSELLQLYVPTRTPALRDLFVDQSGALTAVTLMRHFSERVLRLWF